MHNYKTTFALCYVFKYTYVYKHSKVYLYRLALQGHTEVRNTYVLPHPGNQS